ncbi:MAG: hypothetical protein M1144_02825 [Candidatus Thermoplasmatota archaeon]|jgi:hypothetical protein|nr:hypothetical protein [Candidatus Thermoplasmatota archaeon]
MSDKVEYSSHVPEPHHGGNHWSLKKIVEDVTGKSLEELQEAPSSSHVESAPKREVPVSNLSSFLPQQKTPLFTTIPKELLENVPFIKEEAPSRKKANNRELERMYLAYLMLHMGRLTDPALQYLRHAVEEECRERGLS